MPVIKAMRDKLVADLDPLDVPVHSTWPTAIEAPCVFVAPPLTTAYVSAGPNYSEYTVSMDVVILVEHGPAEDSLDALEDLIELALANTVDWVLAGVDAPAPITVTENGAEYMGTVIHLSKPTRL